MSINQNAFNSRVTSEALEAKFRTAFPSQGGAELIQDLYASGVIVPVVDFTAAAEGSALRSDLQTAFGFGTGYNSAVNTTTTLTSTPGFYKVILTVSGDGSAAGNARLAINDGLGTKRIWSATLTSGTDLLESDELTVFLRSGDSLEITSTATAVNIAATHRQIADLYGNLIVPLGYAPQ